jgi:hypothetical protein
MLEYYFNTGKKLAKAKQRLASYPEEFYKSQTIHSYYTQFDGRWGVKGFRQEIQGVDYLDTLLLAERYIEILEFKHKHFQRYLDTLPHDNRYAIKKKYRNYEILNSYVGVTEELCCQEILEIEEAASYRFKCYTKPEYLMEVSEIPEYTEDNFEESFEDNFNAMLQMLGVN